MPKILVIDDSPTIQKVIKIAFSRYGLTILSASSIEEALKMSAAEMPDLFVMDAAFIENRSVQTLKALADRSEVKIILLVGSYDNVGEKTISQLGLKYRLKKPFASEDIVSSVEKILGDKFPSLGRISPQGLPPLPKGNDFAPHSIEELLSEDVLRGRGEDDELPPPPSPTKAFDGLPPLPKVETRKKGQKAFQEPEGEFSSLDYETTLKPLPKQVQAYSPEPALSLDVLKKLMKELWREDGEAYVKELMTAYCREHFPSIAKEIITKELARLAEERTRLMSE